MKKSKGIKFGKLRVRIKRWIGEGCQRVVYTTDYTKNGKQYVIKKALDSEGILSNRLEYNIYQTLKKFNSKYLKMFPDFAKLSKNGTFLLVERCVTASKKHDFDYDDDYKSERLKEKYFKKIFRSDNHDENWGYTVKGKRPVIIDMAYRPYQFKKLKDLLGLKNVSFDKLKKAPNA